MNPTEMTLEKRVAIAATIFVATGLLAILFRFAPLLIGAPLFAGWFWAATGTGEVSSENEIIDEFNYDVEEFLVLPKDWVINENGETEYDPAHIDKTNLRIY